VGVRLVIPLKDQELIRQKFAAELLGPVKIDYFTERELSIEVPGRRPCAYCKPVRELLQELAALSELISLRVHIFEEAAEERTKFGVERIPGIVLRGAQQAGGPRALLKFYGMPGGTEFPAFLESIVDISRGEVLLSKESVKELNGVREDVLVRVFVTPTCGYCPQMVRAVYQLSLANPKVRAEVIEVNEFPELAERYRVRAVPLTVIGDKVAIPGAMHPDALVEAVVKAGGADVSEAPAAPGPTSAVTAEEAPRAPQRGEQRPSGLIIP
jgi:glutaredoxin-like protein